MEIMKLTQFASVWLTIYDYLISDLFMIEYKFKCGGNQMKVWTV